MNSRITIDVFMAANSLISIRLSDPGPSIDEKELKLMMNIVNRYSFSP